MSGVGPAARAPALHGPDRTDVSAWVCEEVAGWRLSDIPDDVVHTIKLFVLDTVGVLIGARHAPGMTELADRIDRWGARGSATALLTGRRLPPPLAALANGAAAHALDFDDTHDTGRIHGFCVALPALLATAEGEGGVDGERFLLGLAVAAEMHARLGLACYNSLGKGWHPTMSLGVPASGLGAARLIGLSPAGLLDALGIAHHLAGGSAQSMREGALSKRMGAGFAAQGAVTAAGLAASGISGPRRPLEGDAGLFALHERGEVRIAALVEGFGRGWATRDYCFKTYPCCRCNHTTIAIATELHREGMRPADVRRVDVWMPLVNQRTVGAPYDAARDSVVHAQFNAPYSFARALTDGRVDLLSYARPAITDPAVAGLAGRVLVHCDEAEEPSAMAPCRVRVETRGGAVVERERRVIPGSPDDPLDTAGVVDKFMRNVAFANGGHSGADSFVEAVLTLESMPDVSRLASLLPRPET